MNKHVNQQLEDICIKFGEHLRTPASEIHRQLKQIEKRAMNAGINIENKTVGEVQKELAEHERKNDGKIQEKIKEKG